MVEPSLVVVTDETVTSFIFRLLPMSSDAMASPVETCLPKNGCDVLPPVACAPAMGRSRSRLAIRRVRRRANGAPRRVNQTMYGVESL